MFYIVCFVATDANVYLLVWKRNIFKKQLTSSKSHCLPGPSVYNVKKIFFPIVFSARTVRSVQKSSRITAIGACVYTTRISRV